MRYRKYDWLDISTGDVIYGIQVFFNQRWMNCFSGDKALLYRDESIRNEELKRLEEEDSDGSKS